MCVCGSNATTFTIISGVTMDTTETHHRQEGHVYLATVTHLAVCTRVVTTRASAPAKKASQAEIAPSVHPDMSPLQLAADVCSHCVALDICRSLGHFRHGFICCDVVN